MPKHNDRNYPPAPWVGSKAEEHFLKVAWKEYLIVTGQLGAPDGGLLR